MRRVVLQTFVSLDAYAAGAHNSVDFIPASMKGDRRFGSEQIALMDAIDTLLLGKVTYRMFAGYWPNVRSGDEEPFADKFNSKNKIVFSRTLERAPWGDWGEAHIVRREAVDEVRRLKAESGQDMLLSGSISVAQALHRAALIDEYRLIVCPVVLGRGRPLFEESDRSVWMESTHVNRLERGAVSHVYVPSSPR